MNYKKYDLPKYPVTSDMWSELSSEKRPIVVYGMGNGADKLIARFQEYGIKVSDFFASDGFVRGHYFHGMRVKSFEEIKKEYDDFVIVLSFASNREDVIQMLREIDNDYDMYVPDMPVSGDEYFDKDFYNLHYSDILRAYNCLDDENSRNAFSAILNYKLSGRMEYILNAYQTKDELYSELSSISIESLVDVGAYNGDTFKEALMYFPNLKEATLIEPDPKNFKKLQRYIENTTGNIKINTINAAAWSIGGIGEFMSGGNRNSSISSTSSYQSKDTNIKLISVDQLCLDTDYIKYDVEGAEYEALIGSADTIKKSHPLLLVSLYHRSRDIFFLINYLKKEYPFYKMYLRRLKCLPAWEIDLLLFDT